MSYQGREVLLCEDGHIMIVNAVYDNWKSVPLCPAIIHSSKKCRKDWKYRYSIDDTNQMGPMPELKIIGKENIHKCRCGNTHLIESARYAPAEEDGWIFLSKREEPEEVNR